MCRYGAMDPIITKLMADFRIVFGDMLRALFHLPPADTEESES